MLAEREELEAAREEKAAKKREREEQLALQGPAKVAKKHDLSAGTGRPSATHACSSLATKWAERSKSANWRGPSGFLGTVAKRGGTWPKKRKKGLRD